MSRNPIIEAIHEARYDLETCAAGEQAAKRNRLEILLKDALTRSAAKTTQRELLDALYDDYKEFRRTKKRQEWGSI
jgi:hypothetical protein